MVFEAIKSITPEVSLQRGQVVAQVRRENIRAVLRACKEDPRLKFDFLMDVVGVDYLGQKPRFEIVYILYSSATNHRLRVNVRLEEGESLPTMIKLWASADWAEREVWDMYGIKFEGHPNLKRILLYEEFEGHPLRKDYPIERRQKIPKIEVIP